MVELFSCHYMQSYNMVSFTSSCVQLYDHFLSHVASAPDLWPLCCLVLINSPGLHVLTVCLVLSPSVCLHVCVCVSSISLSLFFIVSYRAVHACPNVCFMLLLQWLFLCVFCSVSCVSLSCVSLQLPLTQLDITTWPLILTYTFGT